MRKVAILFCMALTFSHAAHAASTPEQLIARGVKAYIEGNANDAINAWLADSALEGDKQTMMQSSVLGQIESMYGRPVGHDIVKRIKITDRVSNVRFVLNFEKGPVFGSFQVYRDSEDKWVMGTFKFHTDIEILWSP